MKRHADWTGKKTQPSAQTKKHGYTSVIDIHPSVYTFFAAPKQTSTTIPFAVSLLFLHSHLARITEGQKEEEIKNTKRKKNITYLSVYPTPTWYQNASSTEPPPGEVYPIFVSPLLVVVVSFFFRLCNLVLFSKSQRKER
jgi:hypothetical protein